MHLLDKLQLEGYTEDDIVSAHPERSYQSIRQELTTPNPTLSSAAQEELRQLRGDRSRAQLSKDYRISLNLVNQYLYHKQRKPTLSDDALLDIWLTDPSSTPASIATQYGIATHRVVTQLQDLGLYDKQDTPLSSQEQVLEYLAKGNTPQQTATALNLAISTVYNYRSRAR